MTQRKFSRVIFDIETNGLLDTLDRLHCLVLQCADTGAVMSCTDDDQTYPSINEGLTVLYQADLLIGHNIICFDIPAIKKVYKDFQYTGELYDTLTVSRLIYANMINVDFNKRVKDMPMKMYGRHSLASWGYRLGQWKGDYDGGWDKWSKEMQDYCEQDVIVSTAVYNHMLTWRYSDRAIKLEHDFQEYIAIQERLGVPFNEEAATRLKDEVEPQMAELKRKLQGMVPDFVDLIPFTPKRDNKVLGYKKGETIYKEKVTRFNPGSRPQIVRLLKEKYGWNPTDFTDKGNPTVGSEVLGKLTDWEEVPMLIDYLDMVKLSGQLYSGRGAWLKLVENGRIHGGVITNGAVTGRCTHSKPNLGQVPSVRAYKGPECRALFYAPSGFKMVGADASGLELRMLSHYLFTYDGGRYRDILLEDDIHTANQQAAGLSSRDDAKTFIYAFIYGAGDAKLGSIVEPKASESRQGRIGADLRRSFLSKTAGLGQLISDVQRTFKRRRYLIGLDGRYLHARSAHSCLNTLLQGGGAIIMKEATVLQWEKTQDLGAEPALHVHDEYQMLVPEDNAERAGEQMVNAIVQSGLNFKLNCPLDGEYQIGNDWSETH